MLDKGRRAMYALDRGDGNDGCRRAREVDWEIPWSLVRWVRARYTPGSLGSSRV
jgi:hypothetical protein